MKNILFVAFITSVILLIPLFGNFFIEGWYWGVADFVIIGFLLFGTGLAIDFVLKNITHPVHRIGAVIMIVVLLFLVWVELAVDAVSSTLHVLF